MKNITAILLVLALLLVGGCSMIKGDDTAQTTDAPITTDAPLITDAPEPTEITEPLKTATTDPIVAEPDATEPVVTEPVVTDDAAKPEYSFSFSASAINSDEVYTEANLAQFDLVVINIWATWCGPCVSELSALGELYRRLPENVGFISICIDADTASAAALSLLERNNCDFPVLIADSGLNSAFINSVQFIPTTMFLDSTGNLVGESEVGVPSASDITQAYLDMIDERLSLIGK